MPTTRRFRLEVDCDNAAFADEPFTELAAVLRRVADRLDNARGREFTDFEFSGVRDTNGNRCGHVSVKLKRSKLKAA